VVAGWSRLGQNAPVSRIRAFAAYATLLVAVFAAACTSSSGGPAPAPSRSVSVPTSSPPSETSSTAGSTPDSTPPPVTISNPGPPHPSQPRVPRDVPTTGPNTRPGEKPPVMPLEATQHNARGARAFATFFIKTIDWGYATTSSAYMRHYFDNKTCVACRSITAGLDRAAKNNRHFKGDRLTLRRTRAPRLEVHGTIARLSVYFDIGAVTVLNKNDRVVDHSPASTDYREDMDMQWRSDKWVLVVMTPRA
jgi:Family of unknown function (DUF6318)